MRAPRFTIERLPALELAGERGALHKLGMSSDPRIAEEARWLIESVGVCRLSSRVLVRVGGEDARTWLNGQVTNDVRATRPGQAVYALAIHVKGRVLADLYVLDRGERGLAITVPAANLAALLEHFDKYVIMEDVVLEPDPGLAILTAQGPRSGECIAALDGHEVFECDRLGTGGRDVLVSPSEAAATLDALRARAVEVGGGEVSEDGWELARVRLGRPALFTDFGEHTYPQEAGLEDRAVSFNKGCYLGQEVVCMLENRGQLNRRLVRLESEQTFSRGDAITGPDGAKIGEITSAVIDQQRSLGLGFVKRTFATEGSEVRTERASLRVIGPAR